jgi:hypothetical protein
VYEETGFDISDFIVDADFVETMHAQQQTKLFIVADIDEQARMQLCAHARAFALLASERCFRRALPLHTDGLRAADAQGDQQHRVALG